MYSKVETFENDPNFKKVTRRICRRFKGQLVIEAQTVYIPKDAQVAAIPARSTGLKLDLASIAEAQAQADKIRNELS